MTGDSILTFGQFRGHKLKDLPAWYLQHMAAWADKPDYQAVARELLAAGEAGQDLEQQATAFLQRHGYSKFGRRR